MKIKRHFIDNVQVFVSLQIEEYIASRDYYTCLEISVIIRQIKRIVTGGIEIRTGLSFSAIITSSDSELPRIED